LRWSPPDAPEPPEPEVVARLLGREPFTNYSLAVACPAGAPAVLANEPTDIHGRPFPTRYWLACRSLVEAVSRLEADGGVRALEDDPAMASDIREANARHREIHGGRNIGGVRDPARVKCLHAHLAFAMATGGSPIGDWIAERTDITWPARCCAAPAGCDV
jgi:hypothetical protein